MSRAAADRVFPSELGRSAEGSRVDLCGRVLSVSGTHVCLADAFSVCTVELSTPSAIDPLDLVVLRGHVRAGALHDAVPVERHAPRDSLTQPAGEHLRLCGRGIGKNLRARAQATRAVRSFFEDRGFIEVETPTLVPSPGLDIHLDALAVEGAHFSAAAAGYLITSPEYQMKRLIAGGMPRIFQIAHCHRRAEIGRNHNPEFTMVEWYRAFAEVEEVMADTEALVHHVAQVLGTPLPLTPPFERVTVAQAFARHAGVPEDEVSHLAGRDADTFYRLLVEKVEPSLANYDRPVFLTEYPTPFASLARRKPSDPQVAERFELYLGGVELCNGFGELTDPEEQRARLLEDQKARARLGKPVYPIDARFLGALEEGMPPSAGNALGLDRLIATCLGGVPIADVLPFPADWL